MRTARELDASAKREKQRGGGREAKKSSRFTLELALHARFLCFFGLKNREAVDSLVLRHQQYSTDQNWPGAVD